MRIIPVIDLQGGVVVHGIAGQRDQYEPIQSELPCDATPKQVAKALRNVTDCGVIYVADLDAIAGGTPDWQAYEDIADSGAQLLIDAGAGSLPRANELRQLADTSGHVDGVVVALECLVDPSDLVLLHKAVGPFGVFSLDLKGDVPLTQSAELALQSPVALGMFAWHCGFARMIVLDLQQVGSDRGLSTTAVCAQLASALPQLELISGGGVRHRADVATLAEAGCSGALVASALHAGSWP